MSERAIGGYSEERGLSNRFLAEFLPVFYKRCSKPCDGFSSLEDGWSLRLHIYAFRLLMRSG